MIKGARPSFSLHSQAGASFTFNYWWGLGHLLVKGEKKNRGKGRREENEKRGNEEMWKKKRKKETLGKESICLVGIESPESPHPNGAPAHKSVETLRIIEVPSLDRLPYNASEVCELVHG